MKQWGDGAERECRSQRPLWQEEEGCIYLFFFFNLNYLFTYIYFTAFKQLEDKIGGCMGPVQLESQLRVRS